LDSSILLADFVKTTARCSRSIFSAGCIGKLRNAGRSQISSAFASPHLASLVVLQLPLADVYERHWSVTGQDVPALNSPDQAVFLPGRNPLLAIKAALWCQLHQIGQLALATLKSDPFPDATPQFFTELQSVLKKALSIDLQLLRPFDQLDKRQVMELGRDAPLN